MSKIVSAIRFCNKKAQYKKPQSHSTKKPQSHGPKTTKSQSKSHKVTEQKPQSHRTKKPQSHSPKTTKSQNKKTTKSQYKKTTKSEHTWADNEREVEGHPDVWLVEYIFILCNSIQQYLGSSVVGYER